MSLDGAHALVTGGGNRIGLVIADALAAQWVLVAITRRCLEVPQDVPGDGLYALVTDVTYESAQCDIIAKAVAVHGPIQICVANAGIAEGRALQKIDMDLRQRITTTNPHGAFTTISKFTRLLVQADWGRLIAVSYSAEIRGFKGCGVYAASKHGLIGLILYYTVE